MVREAVATVEATVEEEMAGIQVVARVAVVREVEAVAVARWWR